MSHTTIVLHYSFSNILHNSPSMASSVAPTKFQGKKWRGIRNGAFQRKMHKSLQFFFALFFLSFVLIVLVILHFLSHPNKTHSLQSSSTFSSPEMKKTATLTKIPRIDWLFHLCFFKSDGAADQPHHSFPQAKFLTNFKIKWCCLKTTATLTKIPRIIANIILKQLLKTKS